MSIAMTVEINSQSDIEAVVMKVSRVVDAINFGAAYENEALYPVNEAVIAWYQALPSNWDDNPQPRFDELKQLIESTPTESGVSLVVTERQPGLIEINEAD
jgi:hypothetical protein